MNANLTIRDSLKYSIAMTRSLFLCLSIFGVHSILAQNRKDSSDYVYSIEMAQYFFEQNSFETALIYSNRALTMDSTDNDLLLQMSYCHHKLGNYQEAIKYAKIVMNKGDFVHSDPYGLQAYSYLALDVLDSAKFYFNKVIDVNPDDVSARIYRAGVFNQLNMLDSAYIDAKHAMRIAPSSSFVKYMLGLIFNKMEKYDMAAEVLTQAIEYGLKDRATYLELGISQFHLGLFTESLENLNISLSTSTGRPMTIRELNDAVEYLALVNFELGKYISAIEYTKEALERESTFYMGQYILMISSLKLGRVEDARKIYERTAQLVPNEGMLYIGLFHISLAEGDGAKALSCLNKASTMSSEWLTDMHYYMKLYELFAAVDEATKADLMLKKAIERGASPPRSRENDR